MQLRWLTLILVVHVQIIYLRFVSRYVTNFDRDIQHGRREHTHNTHTDKL